MVKAKSPVRMVMNKRMLLEIQRVRLENIYADHKTYHRDLIDHFAPRRGRFTVVDANKGQRKNQKIVNEHALDALSVLKSGMMAGITNPSTDWVRLTIADKQLAETGAVKAWLDDVTTTMNDIFLKSNLYKVLPTIYGDMAVVANGAMLVERDLETVVRFNSLPIGSYMISANDRGKVDTVFREFRMTVRQLVTKFGFDEGEPFDQDKIQWDRFSDKIKLFWERGEFENWVDVVHGVLPNPNFDENKLEAKFKRYSSTYYERGTVGSSASGINENLDPDVFLRESGFDLFPILVPRWETTGEDAWGTNCPAMKAIGSQRALQKSEKRLAQADELGINPPMNYPKAGRNRSSLPGAKNYVSNDDEGKIIRPSMEVNFDKPSMVNRMERYENRIDQMFHKKAFVAISDLDKANITATEINARLNEGRLMVAGTLVNVQDDLLEPTVDITFDEMLAQDLIPPAPDELQGLDLKVEFIGILAQAQKSISLGGLRGIYQDVGEIATLAQDPTVWDKIDTEQLIDELAEAGGVTPSVVVSDEEVAFIKEQRVAQEQAAVQAEQLQAITGSAKNLSETDLSGDNALAAIAENVGI